MGVTGLWRLIEPAGKPVPVETLENKVLAVDISIWLHQMVKGYQDAKGAPLPNAHLMGLFQRLCKLLYFRIKPVFVFDGGFPDLKKETIARRQDHKAKYNSESERIKRELAILLSKKTAVNSLLGKQISPKQSTSNADNHDDIFKLPALPQRDEESETESEDESSSGSIVDLHSVDIESANFKNMSAKEKYDLLIELKETRKMNSWGKLHELPKKSDSFSDFQMQRLLKRRKVQECLEETEKEMGDSGMSLNELESLLNEEGIDTKIDTIPTRRIASNETTRFLFIKDVKQALAAAKKREEEENNPGVSEIKEKDATENSKSNDELEDDLQKAIKMSLECVDDPNVSVTTSKTDDSWTSCMTDSDEYSYDSEEEDGFEQPDNMSTAKAYIMQYSDFTHKAIDDLVSKKRSNKNKPKVPKVDKILEEINNEKSVIVDNVELSSNDEDCIEDKIASQSSEPNFQNSLESKSISEELESKSRNFLDSTQASVVCVENQQDIINIDTSTEEIETELIEKIPKTIIKQDPDSSDLEFEDESVLKFEVTTPKPQIENTLITNTDNKNESDSSDNEFEEVPEIDKRNKPIVQLTLNMGDAPDDDIFADIFEENNASVINKIKPNTENVTALIDSKLKETGFNVVDNDDRQSKKTNINTEPIKSTSNTVENPEKNVTGANDNNQNSKVDVVENKLPNVNTTKANQDDINKQSEASNTSGIVNNPHKEILNTEKLNSLVEEMQNEEQGLLQEKGRLDRIGRNITEQMTKEAQELLQIFGIPYIVAPMEAEAQCAFLENAKLTDGTITDDSDIWLFGGRTVYKNFFNQKKHVLQFLSERIEKSFNLNREQLVLLALLVGSDYTTGLSGVGPVTALEILASFPFNRRQLLNETSKQAKYTEIVKGLQEFKQWVRAGKRTDNISLKKKLKNVNLTDDFPSVRVVQAYLEPNIEKSEEKFSWGELDLTILRDYTKAKFGWSQNKLDEIIKPVLKRMLDRKTQRSVQDFFKRKVDFQSLEDQMSKRVKAAVQRMGPEKPLEVDNLGTAEESKPARKRKVTKGKTTVKNRAEAEPSSQLRKEDEGSVLGTHGVKVVSQIKDGKTEFQIKIPRLDRYQEIIPQREKEKHSLLQNKMKAIEVFRRSNIDRRKKTFKKRAIQPKDKAELSESDSD